MNIQIKVGDAIKVNSKLYLVWDVRENNIFARQFYFSKAGRFQYYQDRVFSVSVCELANEREKQIVNHQRIQASLQRKSQSPLVDCYERHLVR